MGRISTSSRYVIDITGTDPLSLGEFEAGCILINSEKFEK